MVLRVGEGVAAVKKGKINDEEKFKKSKGKNCIKTGLVIPMP